MTAAQKATAACKGKSVQDAKAILEKMGAVWVEYGGVYVFADGSCGAFTDMRQGAQVRDTLGNPVYHFRHSEGSRIDEVPASVAAAALGRIKSPRKAKSSAANGGKGDPESHKRGGRPRKTNRAETSA